MFNRLFSLDHRRERLLRKAPAGPLRSFLSAPFPPPRSDCRDTQFLAVDLETTGLNPRSDQIVSMGWVMMTGRQIDLATARHRLVAPSVAIPEHSAVIHQITDDQAAGGSPLQDVLVELLTHLAGRVLLAHHARMEFQFLNIACERSFGSRFLVPVVDTQWIERRALERRGQAYGSKALRLSRLRTQYNLPRYRAHDALSDALAAGELFLAQLTERSSSRPLELRDFLLRL